MKLIKDIKKEIENLTTRLNLKNCRSFDWYVKNKKRFYTSVCSKDGTEVLFKCEMYKKSDLKEGFKKEINFHKIVKNERIKEIRIPAYITSCFDYKENSFLWYVREVVDGNMLCEIIRSRQDIKKSIWEDLMEAVYRMSYLSEKYDCLTKKMELKAFGFKKNIKEINLLLKKIENFDKNVFTAKDKKLINNYLFNFKEAVDKARKSFAHGDLLNCNNLIIQRNKIFVFDFEHIHINNFMYDFTDILIYLKNNKKNYKEVADILENTLIPNERKLYRDLLRFNTIGNYLRNLYVSCIYKDNIMIKYHRNNIKQII